jgi:endo-1,4-beta-xylanase
MKKILYSILLFLFFLACKKVDYDSCSDEIGLYKLAKYPIGYAIDYSTLINDVNYSKIATQQFNSVTAEYAFKAEYLAPLEGVYNFSEADSIVAFATRNNQRVHGHTLIWHLQIPNWIKDFNGNNNDWELLFKNYIQTVVLHFKNKVTAWDVVNEAFNEDGTLRNSIWKEKLGSTYIERAFKYVQEVDNNVLLFYNDYNLESNTAKRNAVIQLLNNLRLKGVKVNGIGLQMHINTTNPELTQIAIAIKQVVDNQYQLHIAELDISVNPLSKDMLFTADLASIQASLYAGIIQHYNQIAKAYQYGITFWGITDRYSWIRSYYNRIDFPLLYDDNYLPKPAYCAIKSQL